MKIDKEIVIAGLARDCAHSLPGLLQEFERLADRFNACHFIFLENDSLDATKAILKEFAQKRPEAIVRFHDKIGKKHPKRTDRLAFLRNQILSIAQKHVGDPAKAYLLLLDLDGANTKIDVDRITKHITEDDGSWAGLFANQETDYCDLWALRHPDYCPYDIWEKVRNRPADMDKKEAIAKYITAIRFILPKDSGLVEVESAFGGMGLYRFTPLQKATYVGLDEAGNEICEHVALNNDIRANGGRLFIDSALINAVGDEQHAPSKSRLKKKIDKLRSFLRNL